MLNLLHLSEKAQESLSSILAAAEAQPASAITPELRDALDCHSTTLNVLREGVPFQLPENGDYISGTEAYDLLETSCMSLPYPITLFEYRTEYDLTNPKQGKIDYLVLAVDSEQAPDNPFVRAAREAINFSGEFIVLSPITPQRGEWAAPIINFALRKELVDPAVATYENDELKGEIDEDGPVIPVQFCLFTLKPQYKQRFSAAQDLWLSERGEYSRTEHIPVLNTLAMLSCSNVGIRQVGHAVALNKKRVKRGKPPIKPRASLVIIDTKKTSTKQTVEDMELLKTAAYSVKTHPRRGHIRRLYDGRKIWVRACIVNPDGGGEPKESQYLLK